MGKRAGHDHHTIVTMTRGDGPRIVEWATYHAAIGFDDLQIVLDGDVDGTEGLLRALRLPARVTLHVRDEVGDYHDGLVHQEREQRVARWRERHAAELASGAMRGTDAVAWRQHTHFPGVLAPYTAGLRGRGWLGLVDVDEYVVLSRHRTIGEVLAEQEAPRARLLSFNVDTTDHDPARPVLEQHTRRWSRADLLAHPDRRWARRVKSFVRYRHAELSATVHKISRGRHVVVDPDVARLHHFKMPPAAVPDLPFSVDDPVRPPRR